MLLYHLSGHPHPYTAKIGNQPDQPFQQTVAAKFWLARSTTTDTKIA